MGNASPVDVGLGFTIDAKVNVNRASQYKIYYVTSNEAYVYVK